MFTPLEAINRLCDKREIFYDEMVDLMRQVMEGKVPPVQLAAILMGLHVKTESVSEIAAAASVMREFSTKVDASGRRPPRRHLRHRRRQGAHVQHLHGGGVRRRGRRARVAKHGGRSVSSQSGSADVLEGLGVNLALTPEQVAQSIREVGVGFMFAPNHHPAMKHAAPVRKELGMRTILNILGPLTNPAGAPNQVMGVFHADLVGIQARVLKMLGSRHVLTVHGHDGLDEITITGPTQVAELKHDFITEYTIEPKQFGFDVAPIESIQVKDAAESKARVEAVLANEAGPSRDVVVLNAAAALYVSGVAPSLWDGVALARDALATGRRAREARPAREIHARAAEGRLMSDVLTRILAAKRREVEEAKARVPAARSGGAARRLPGARLREPLSAKDRRGAHPR